MDVKIIRVNMDEIQSINQPLSACIGYFDGLHVGHQKLVNKVLENSEKDNLTPALITFDPDPIVVVKKFDNVKHIMTLEDKIHEAKQLGMHVIVLLEIDERMMKLSPDQFVKLILKPLNIKNIVCGFDFRFGYKGQGTAQTLLDYEEWFSVDIIEEVDYQQQKISSTRIIETLKAGDVQEVKLLLGRPYTISGEIVAGNQKGREIGFPTANMKVNPEYHDVKEGVYITKMYVHDTWYPAMTNVGHNLTFNTSEPISVETYILDFNEKIYGQTVKLAFYKFLREELKFDNVQQLIHQMQQDKVDTIDFFETTQNC